MKALASAIMVTAALAGMSAAHAEGKTREQVQQELRDAKAAGQVTFGEEDYPPAAAAAQGAAAQTPVASTSAAPARQSAGKTREQVRAELAQAKARGEYTFGELDYPPKDR
ncbi:MULTISPECIES: DUF4148 domain-containing protein [unclassified Achromobacter]|uniref:DUF4148 domain-containing protein n=1 Tax=unclassified Achromobacter TaxID=2626865 RepID=UPI00069F6319|nr:MULTISPECIES: DUF4148 domain-containing protein [unclassified Achromobacter]KOF54083.1 hypothetical protein AD428_09350 [Achromobacter sp. DMS1]